MSLSGIVGSPVTRTLAGTGLAIGGGVAISEGLKYVGAANSYENTAESFNDYLEKAGADDRMPDASGVQFGSKLMTGLDMVGTALAAAGLVAGASGATRTGWGLLGGAAAAFAGAAATYFATEHKYDEIDKEIAEIEVPIRASVSTDPMTKSEVEDHMQNILKPVSTFATDMFDALNANGDKVIDRRDAKQTDTLNFDETFEAMQTRTGKDALTRGDVRHYYTSFDTDPKDGSINTGEWYDVQGFEKHEPKIRERIEDYLMHPDKNFGSPTPESSNDSDVRSV